MPFRVLLRGSEVQSRFCLRDQDEDIAMPRIFNSVLAVAAAVALPAIVGLGDLFIGTALHWLFPFFGVVLFFVCLSLLPKIDIPPLLKGVLGTLVSIVLFLEIIVMAAAFAGTRVETVYYAVGLLVFLVGLWWAPRSVR
jgi:uncharacterized membrane protein YiaA